MLTNGKTRGHIIRPGKLPQVPPADGLIIGCDKRPELPVINENKKTTKGGYSSFLVNNKITGEFIQNQRVVFDPDGNLILLHGISL